MTLAAERVPQATMTPTSFNGFVPVERYTTPVGTAPAQPYLEPLARPLPEHEFVLAWPKVDLGPSTHDYSPAEQQEAPYAESHAPEHPAITSFNRVLQKAGLFPNATNIDLITDEQMIQLQQLDDSDEMALYGLLHTVNRGGLHARKVQPDEYTFGVERSRADVEWFEARAHRMAGEQKQQQKFEPEHDLHDHPQLEARRDIGVAPVSPRTKQSTVAPPLPEKVTTFTNLAGGDKDPAKTNSWKSWQHEMDATSTPDKPTGGIDENAAGAESDGLENLSEPERQKLLAETNRSIRRMRVGLVAGTVATGAAVIMANWGETVTKWGETLYESVRHYF